MFKSLATNKNLTTYLIGRFISSLGNSFLFYAQSISAYVVTGKLSSVGLLWIIRGLSSLLFIPVGGFISDRFPRKYTILVTDFVSGFVSLSYIFAGGRHLALFGLLVCISQIINRIYDPAAKASFKDVASGTELEMASSISSIMGQIATIVGPALASLIYILYSGNIHMLFLGDGISFFVCFVFMVFVNFGTKQSAISKSGNFLKEMYRGGTYVLSERKLFLLLLLMVPMSLSGKVFEVLVLQMSNQKWGFGQLGGVGLYLAVFAIGGILASTQLPRYKHLTDKLSVYSAACMGLGSLFVLFGLIPNIESSLIITLLLGAFLTMSVIMAQVNIQRTVPNEVLGRVFATWTFLAVVGGGIGAYISGLLSDMVGMRLALILLGIFVALPSIIFFTTTLIKQFKASSLDSRQERM
jgi:MFS transporter, DHA3 family, macrolide efflux protein